MPRQSDSVDRIEIQFPRELATILRERCGRGEIQEFVRAAVAKALRVPYTPERGRGRPRKAAAE